jgi:hypothetical protein
VEPPKTPVEIIYNDSAPTVLVIRDVPMPKRLPAAQGFGKRGLTQAGLIGNRVFFRVPVGVYLALDTAQG